MNMDDKYKLEFIFRTELWTFKLLLSPVHAERIESRKYHCACKCVVALNEAPRKEAKNFHFDIFV